MTETVESIFSLPGCKFSEPNPRWCHRSAELGPADGEPPRDTSATEGFSVFTNDLEIQGRRRSDFPPGDFTPNALLMDSFATVCGAEWGSLYFRLIFAFFPNLSGPHFDFAANDNIFITNWGFLTTNGKQEIFVPAIDIFGFKGGLVNYRLATFDVLTLVRSLLIAYGGTLHPRFEGNLAERVRRWATDRDFAEAGMRQ
jgi:hypothetical protein